jgi:hypothetical protein
MDLDPELYMGWNNLPDPGPDKNFSVENNGIF